MIPKREGLSGKKSQIVFFGGATRPRKENNQYINNKKRGKGINPDRKEMKLGGGGYAKSVGDC